MNKPNIRKKKYTKKKEREWGDLLYEVNLNENIAFLESINYALGWLKGSKCEYDFCLANLQILCERIEESIYKEIGEKK